jgi:hypothetical protein
MEEWSKLQKDFQLPPSLLLLAATAKENPDGCGMKSGTHDRPDYDPGNLAGFRSGGSMNVYAVCVDDGSSRCRNRTVETIKKIYIDPCSIEWGLEKY